jgi:hypothetical protein
MKWTSELMDKMWKLYKSGKTFGEIAEEVGCTRNAAIGKARRSNFTPRDQRPASSIVFTSTKKAPPRPMRKPEPAPDKDYRCTIMELTDSRCRYPLWDHGAKKCEYYCGAPGAALSASRPYCSVHMRVCITHKPR